MHFLTPILCLPSVYTQGPDENADNQAVSPLPIIFH